MTVIETFICRGIKWEPCASCKVAINYGRFCDWPLLGVKAGQTCDRFCCRNCSKQTEDGKDYCLPHYQKILDGQKPPAAPRRPIVRTVCMNGWPVSAQAALVREAPCFIDVSRTAALLFKGEPQELPPAWPRSWVGHLSTEEFTRCMRETYLQAKPTIDAILSRDKIVIACYCLVSSGCRRGTMAQILGKLGACVEPEEDAP